MFSQCDNFWLIVSVSVKVQPFRSAEHREMTDLLISSKMNDEDLFSPLLIDPSIQT